MKTTLYLARHGQTQWNNVKRFQGQLDSDLTEIGQQQSTQLAKQLANKNINLIFSSTLGRAMDSALICQQLLKKSITHLNEIMERDLGDWQGQYISDISTDKNYHEILHQFTNLAPPHGESATDCGLRIEQALKKLAKHHINKNLLIIFHGEALRCFLAKLGHNSTDNAYELYDNGCVLQLSYLQSNDSFQRIT